MKRQREEERGVARRGERKAREREREEVGERQRREEERENPHWADYE